MVRRILGCFGFFSVVVFFSVVASVAHAQAINGILKVVKGDVQIVQASDGKTVAAKLGQKVFPKDIIIAGKDSRAKIVMIDNNEINISPDTKFEIKSYEYKPEDDKKNVLLNVMYGKVRAKVSQHYEGDNKFQVKTPSAVAGVRGTDFMTSFDPATQASNVVTFSGKVAFGQPGAGGQINNAVFVGPGQTSSSKSGGVPTVALSVPKGDLAKMDNDSDPTRSHPGDTNNSRQPAGGGKGANNNSNGNSSSNSNSNGGATAAAGAGGSAASPSASSNTSNMNANAPAAAPVATAAPPMPAAIAPPIMAAPPVTAMPSMMLPTDLPTAALPTVPTVPTVATIITPPPVIVLPSTCVLCNQVIQNTKVNVSVIVKGGP
jgi:FecR protein